MGEISLLLDFDVTIYYLVKEASGMSRQASRLRVQGPKSPVAFFFVQNQEIG